MALNSSTARDQIAAALGIARQVVKVSKVSVASMVAGGYGSLWRAGSLPGAGAAPTTAALCTKATTGAGLNFNNAGAGNALYLAGQWTAMANGGSTLENHDRIAHMGGLSGTVTTAQTVNLDPVALGAATDRTGAVSGTTAFNDLRWWLEWYTATGSTAVTATVTYTNAAGTTGRTTTVLIPASTAASRALPIIGSGGEAIASIQSVTLSASTLTAGNFGVTCTRKLSQATVPVSNYGKLDNWADTGMPLVGANACLVQIMLCQTTTTGVVTADLTLVEI